MKRRDFLQILMQSAAAASLPGIAHAICPPQNLRLAGTPGTAPTGTCGVSSGNSILANAAAALNPGQSAPFTQSINQFSRRLDIQWIPTCGYYDSIRKEIQYMGKPASGQSTTFSHYIYSEASNTWRETNPAAGGLEGIGHIWNSCFDPATGDYYHIQFQNPQIFRMTRATLQWSVITTVPTEYSSSGGDNSPGPWPGTGWHPNLFGPGDGGIVLRGARGIFGWRKSTNSWQSFVTGMNWNYKAGADHVFFPDTNEMIMGTGYPNGTEDLRQLIRVRAGANGTLGSYTVAGTAPLPIAGRAQDHVAKMVAHPNDPTRLIILEEKDPNSTSSARWWISSDRGATWNLQSTPHPFRGLGWQNYTLCCIPSHKIIVGIFSGHTTGLGYEFRMHLWKPNI